MNTKILLCILFLNGLFATQTFGQIIVEESFNYTIGELNGQGTAINGWGGAWVKTSGIIEIVDGNLGNDTIGNTLQTQIDTINTYYFRQLATKWVDDGKDIWISFYLKRVPAELLSWGGLSLFNGDNEDLFMGCPWQSGFVGFGSDATTAPDTLLHYILVKLEMNGTPAADSAFMWVNYFGADEPGKATSEAKQAWGADGFTSIRIGSDKTYSISYDKIRFSSTFEPNIVDIPVTGISLSPENLELSVGEKSTLKVTVIPYNATNRKYSFSSSSETVATVSQTGKITAIDVGTATITVTTEEGSKTATCNVVVTEKADPQVYDAAISDQDQQIIKGWGATPLWIDNYDIAEQPLVAGATIDMGITMLRFSQLAYVGDGDGNINVSGTEKLINAITIAKDAGLPYILSRWSPPVDMKTIATPGSMSDDEKVYLKTDKEQTLCNLVVNLFDYISKTKGLPLPVAYSLQNEPTNGSIWAGCMYSPQQYQRVAIMLRSTLNNAGYENIFLLGPEDGSYNNGDDWGSSVFFMGGTGFPALQDTAFNDAIATLASHSYEWGNQTSLADYNAWVYGCDNSGKDRWQTEYCSIDDATGVPQAISTTRRLISDIAFIKNNVWCTWTVSDGEGNDVQEALCFGDGANSLTKKPAYYVLRKLFTSVPVGAKVRKVTSTDKALVTTKAGRMDMVSFVSDTNMVVVVVNPTLLKKTTNINGLRGNSAKIFQMATTENNTDMELVNTHSISGNTLSNVALPANSVTIITITGVVTGVSKLKADSNLLQLFPNPATDYFSLKSIGNCRVSSLIISNISGQCLLKTNSCEKVNISSFKPGTYIVSAFAENRVYKFKLVKN
jgi:O-glycosyl hydrolase